MQIVTQLSNAENSKKCCYVAALPKILAEQIGASCGEVLTLGTWWCYPLVKLYDHHHGLICHMLFCLCSALEF
jgi:hypothetical protein